MSGTPRIASPGTPPLLWSSVEEAFRQINQNFNELYATIQSDGSTQVVNFSELYDDVSPAIANAYKLGEITKAWKNLYVSSWSEIPGEENNGVWLGSAQIKGTIDGIIDLPLGSTVNGELIINPDQTFFKSVQVDSGNQIVADEFVDILNINSGTAIQIVVDSASESLTVNNTGVTSLISNNGISISSSTGDITVTNTGVLSLTNVSTLPSGLSAGSGISVSNSTGNVTITNTGVLDIQNGFGITVSRDDATGVVSITNSAPAQVAYRTIRVNGSPDLVADSTADILVVEEGYGIILTTSETLNDTLIVSLDQNIDIIGSVFADNSSMMVDAVDQKIYASGGFFGGLLGDTEGYHTGDVKGSVFGDDSSILVDAVGNRLPAERVTGIFPTVDTDDKVKINGDLTILAGLIGSTNSTISSLTAQLAILNSQLFAPPYGGNPIPGANPTIQSQIDSVTTQLNDANILLATYTSYANDPDVEITYNAETSEIRIDKKLVVSDIVGNLVGDITGDVFTNLIDSADSSEINIVPGVNCNSNLTVGGDILPSSDLGGDLGSPTQQWKSLYVSGSTIFLGGVPVSIENGSLSIGGSGVVDETYVDNAIANLVASAPATLDTLNELAAALGDDANFASTVTTALGNKLESLADDTTPQLSGNLDLNNFDIDGTGNINITGDITSTNITGSSGGTISGYTNITGDSGGTISQFTNITGDSGGTISQFTNITGDSGGTISQFTNITGDSGGTISGFTTLTGDGGGSISGFSDITVTTVFAGTIDTVDSSAITVVPAVTFNSDVTVENELFVSNSITAANFLGNVTASSVVTSSITTSKVKESVSEKTGATGIVVHDLSTSSVFYHTSISANFTANFTNLDIAAGQGTNISLLLVQGGTAYIPNAVQIGGVAQTINWQDSSPPTGNINKIDIVTFSIVRIGDTYTVFGALTTFGT